MKKISLLSVLIALVAISCFQRNIIISEDKIPEDIFYLDNEIIPYTGTCTIYYNNSDKVKEEMSFKDGILNGPHNSYYRNGQLKRTGSFLNGNLQGKWIGYNCKGNKIFEVGYSKDTLFGEFISWYSTGIIKEKGFYKNNKKVGEWKSYDESGMLIKKISL